MKLQQRTAPSETRFRVGTLGTLAGLVGIGCCIYPTALALFGLASATEAVALGNRLYGESGWVFKLAGAGFAVAGVVVQLRRRGQCNLPGARRNRASLARVALLAVGVYFAVYFTTKALAAWAT